MRGRDPQTRKRVQAPPGRVKGVPVRVCEWFLSKPQGTPFTAYDLPLEEGEVMSRLFMRAVNEAVARMRRNGANIKTSRGKRSNACVYTYHGSTKEVANLLTTRTDQDTYLPSKLPQMDKATLLMARAACLPVRRVPELFGASS
jgi:hypothetical protein